jgi:hypothetical protein
LGPDLPLYRDVLTSFALEQKAAGGVPNETFTVTPAMRQQVLDRLKQKGVDLTAEEFNQGGRLIDQQLGYEIARYVFGRPAESRRRARDDRQVQTALELLRKAGTPKELLGLAIAGNAERNGPN